MKIEIAEHAGFCFGVKRAIDLTENWLKENRESVSLGELVHNPHVVNFYREKGLKPIDQYDNDIVDTNVVIRAHGIPLELEEKLIQQNNNLCDTTCTLVKKVHNDVLEADKKGHKVIIIGDSEHPEVKGIASYGKDVIVINTIEEAKRLNINDDKPLTIVSQTTNRKEHFYELVDILKDSYTNINVINTICNATKNRQEACRELSKTVDAMIVIGGKNSSNTNKLAQVARQECKNVFHIESIEELEAIDFKQFNQIGITAGASTPDWIIKEAINYMENLNNNEMMEAIESSFTRIRRGDIVKGEVLFVTDSEVMVNINYRSDGIISKEELSNEADVKPSDLFEQGDEIEVYVLKIDDGDGNVVLSTRRVESMKNWDVLQEKFENEEAIEVEIQNVVKGGLTCTAEGLNAFMPASHVSAKYVKDLSQFKGQTMTVKIIDFDKDKRRIIVSRKEIEMKEIEEKRKEIYAKLNEGDIVKGTVQRLTNFGAFVDLGGVDGLIHISELSWHRVKHPREVVSTGEEVEVMVLNVDEERNRIALGLKQTTEEPWEKFIKTVKEGDVVTGKVVNLLDFGAFIRLESGVDGLLHVSQIAKEHVDKPSDRFEIGDEVTVKVTDINEEERKISLSIRALTEEKEKKEEPKPEPIEEVEEDVVEEYEEEEPEVEEVYSDDDGFNTTIGDILNNK